MADVSLPTEIVDWIRARNWGPHHLQWHTERQWDILPPEAQQWARQQGWNKVEPQEGAPGNGFDFLLMHRAMLQLMREDFPQFRSYFVGWTTVPTDPDAPDDPVPAGQPREFSSDMRRAIERLTNQLNSFPSEDALGLFIETRIRPTLGNPFALSPDRTTGIHNYLHNRFSDGNSPIDLGKPEFNLFNTRFWKLHGWIDARWAAYRQAKGLSDTDDSYQRALRSEKDAMRNMGVVHPHHHAAGLEAIALTAPGPVPAALSSPHRETAARRLQQLMANTPVITEKAELAEYLQTAIQVEHGTLPLYLTAMWSIKDTASEAYLTIREIALEEMLHMGIVSNLLKAIGETPKINDPLAIPVFPGSVPGLDLSDTIVGDVALERLSKRQLGIFIRIEKPKDAPVEALEAIVVPRFKTIGEFYDVIIAGVKSLSAQGKITFAGGGQVTDGHVGFGGAFDALKAITSEAIAVAQLELIKEQGEGHTGAAPAPGGEIPHFDQFKAIRANLPPPQGIYQFPAVSATQDPAPQVAFNEAYSRMLDSLQSAWSSDPNLVGDAVGFMFTMTEEAVALMKANPPVGPTFRYLPPPADATPAAAMLEGFEGVEAVALPGYARIQQILDESVQGGTFGGHGPFWRGLTRDQFVAKKVFGRAVIVSKPDGSFDPDASFLVKALEGRAPFGRDLPNPPPGAIWNRMPLGFPPVPQEQIDEIRAWIAGGCPNLPPAAPSLIDDAAPVTMSADDFNRFWRQFDDVALFHATQQVQDDINEFFGIADQWLAFAKDAAQEPAWAQALTPAVVTAAIVRLEQLQRDTIVQAFGSPVGLANLLAAFERFGDNSLPDDALRTVDPRHTMNGEVMWFFWASFCDACTRLAAAGAAP